MVILPFYRFLIGTEGKAGPHYSFITRTGRPVPAVIPVRFPSFNREAGMIYGLWNNRGKSEIGRTTLQPPYSVFSALFALSDRIVSHTAVSPDNTKIAFLATDEKTGETQLRVIAREELGWFPLPYIRLPAALAPICFALPGIVIYTAPSGALNAVRLMKPAKTAQLFPRAENPAYCPQTRATAFTKDGKLFVHDTADREIESEDPTTFIFSRNGDALFVAEGRTLFRIDLSNNEKAVVFEASLPIFHITEL